VNKKYLHFSVTNHLIERLIIKPLPTFEEIYAENHVTIYRVAKKIIGDGDTVSDIIQDVFIDLFGKMQSGTEIRHPKSWLYKATCNKCIDKIRRTKRFRPIESVKDFTVDQDFIENRDLKDAVKTALSKLKPRDRLLAVLYSEGLTYKEMAAATGIRLASIGKLLSRTLEKIEKDFKNQGYELY
jgi:RNA polymerase sigma-70 factor, ECF subfamily